MTQEDFYKLTDEQKENFLNRGNTLSVGSDDTSGTVRPVAKDSIIVEPPNRVTEGSGGSIPADVSTASVSQSPSHLPSTSRKETIRKDGSTRAYDEFEVDYNKLQPNVFSFKDPVDLLFFIDEDLQKGRQNGGYDLHPWQIQIMVDFAKGIHNETPSQDNPFQAVVRACNGSGKDRIVIAACAAWLCMCTTMYASAVVTSSSGVQLDNQTCSGIERICDQCNKKIHPRCWKINYRYYECLDTRSPVMCFATDEPGKAEGYHPITFNAAFALFESEAKTVPDEIYLAQNKCTGYTHRCIVSTPDSRSGHFFDLDSRAIPRSEFNKSNSKKLPTDYVKYHIQAKDCPHLSKNYVEQMKLDLPGGELGDAFQSQVYAEFGSGMGEQVVIPYVSLWRLYNNHKVKPTIWISEPMNKAGVDLARGGDECVFTVRNGNKVLAQVPFTFKDTEDTVAFLVELFRKYNLNSPDALIFIDCGGLGAPIYDRLRGLGWVNCRYVVNQGSAHDKRQYKNKGAEMWWNLGKLVERKEIILPDDPVLKKQIVGRHYKKVSTGVYQLLDKKEEKSKYGYSPDRADSLVLCFSDLKPSNYEAPKEEALPFKPTEDKVIGDFTLRANSTYKDKNAGLPTTRINPEAFDELRSEFNLNRNRQTQLN